MRSEHWAIQCRPNREQPSGRHLALESECPRGDRGLGLAVATVVSVFAPWVAVVAAQASTVFAAIVGVDLAWSTLTYGTQPSDGVVERPSQVYPGTGTPQFPLINRQSDNPSSHTAQIASERSATDIQRTLIDELGVVER